MRSKPCDVVTINKAEKIFKPFEKVHSFLDRGSDNPNYLGK